MQHLKETDNQKMQYSSEESESEHSSEIPHKKKHAVEVEDIEK